MKIHSILLACTLLTACGQTPESSTFHEQTESTQIARPFKFKLFTSDIFPWITGERFGPIPGEMGSSAYFLQSLMHDSNVDLSLAVYGVQNQGWFFDALGLGDEESLSTNIEAVVDQERGALNDWRRENFMYADTDVLGRALGEGRIIPDLNPNGNPRASTIMHNKFVIAHGEGVWTGSANISETDVGAEYSANTAIYLPFPEIARVYQAEFNQMFNQHRFSVYKADLNLNRSFSFSDRSTVEIFFSPQNDPLANAVIPFIERAKKSLDVGMFVMSDIRIKERLIAAHERGVKVRVILDALFAARTDSYHKELRSAGIEVRVENWGGKMHMKTAIADKESTIMGSMNWTRAGSEKNDENLLLIKNKSLANDLTNYFNRLWRTLNSSANSDPRAESKASINSCHDEIDNDYDGAKDKDDSAC